MLDHVDRALGHAVGEFLDGDRLRDRHFARNLFLRLAVAMAVHALHAAAERGDRALANLVGAERGDDGQPAAALLGAGARSASAPVPDARRRRRAAALDAALPLRRLPQRGGGRVSRRLGGVAVSLAAESLLRRPRSALRLVSSSCRRRSSSSRLRASASSRSARLELFALVPAARFLFGDLALFGLAHLGVGQRVGARAALFLGERAQHDAGRLRRRGCGRSRCGARDGRRQA